MRPWARFYLGLASAFCSTISISYGNILFKKRKMNGDVNLAQCLFFVFLGNALSVVSMGFLPLNIASSFAVLVIIWGLSFNFVIFGKVLSKAKICLMFLLCVCVIGVITFGQHHDKTDIFEVFQNQIKKTPSLLFYGINITMQFISMLAFALGPADKSKSVILHVLGSYFTATVGMYTQTLVKIALFLLFHTAFKPWYVGFIVLTIAVALVQLKGLKFMMGNMRLELIFPLYQSLIIIFPAFSGMVVFQERPSDPLGFWSFLSLMIVLLMVLCVMDANGEKTGEKTTIKAYEQVNMTRKNEIPNYESVDNDENIQEKEDLNDTDISPSVENSENFSVKIEQVNVNYSQSISET